jgi:hypothetical protein
VCYGRKSYALPNGQAIGYRTAEAVWEVVDPEALDAWTGAHDLVRVSVEADWGGRVKPRLAALLDEPGRRRWTGPGASACPAWCWCARPVTCSA